MAAGQLAEHQVHVGAQDQSTGHAPRVAEGFEVLGRHLGLGQYVRRRSRGRVGVEKHPGADHALPLDLRVPGRAGGKNCLGEHRNRAGDVHLAQQDTQLGQQRDALGIVAGQQVGRPLQQIGSYGRVVTSIMRTPAGAGEQPRRSAGKASGVIAGRAECVP